MDAMLEGSRLMKLLEFIPTQNVTIRQLGAKSGIERRTVRKYVKLIAHIQNSPRIRIETIGLRVLVRREK
jgi:response regulator of citrate/malate metabolism